MITSTISLDDPELLPIIAEFLDARLAGILGPDWTIGEYIARRLKDEQRKTIGGLSADDDNDSDEEF